jgi:hypothetical protein
MHVSEHPDVLHIFLCTRWKSCISSIERVMLLFLTDKVFLRRIGDGRNGVGQTEYLGSSSSAIPCWPVSESGHQLISSATSSSLLLLLLSPTRR